MPALTSKEPLEPVRLVLTWKFARPVGLNSWVQFDADIRGPEQALRIIEMTAVIQSFRFDMRSSGGDTLPDCCRVEVCTISW